MKKALAILGMAATLALGGLAVEATPLAPAPQSAHAALYVSCYIAMDGGYWCWRYGCTAREEMAGCYTGWYYRGNVWYS